MFELILYIITGVVCVILVSFTICSLVICSRADDDIEDLITDDEIQNFIRQREEILDDGENK
jgi:hypothetical protein